MSIATLAPPRSDRSVFPDPVYRETVLKPLFDGAKIHHAAALRAVDEAHLVMLAETSILDATQARGIALALARVWDRVDPALVPYEGEVEDFFFMMEGELKREAGPDLGGRLHTARSRNDIDHTLFKLGLKERTEALLAKARHLLATLIEVARRESGTLVLAYTHGQPAQPTTFGHYLGAVIEVLARDMERMEAALAIVDRSPMGAAAITTSGFPIDRHRVAALLGFAEPLRNSYGCIAGVDYVTSTFSAMELMFLHLGRPIQDFQVWSSFEVGQLRLPDAFVQISSIMPQKRNPVAIEHLRHLASQTYARAKAVIEVMHNTPFTDMNDCEGETQEFGYQAFASAERVLDLLAAVVDAATIEPEHVAWNLRRSCATITELADTLVRRENLPFRIAHEIAGTVAKAVVARSGDLAADGYPAFDAVFREATGRAPAMDPATFAETVSPERFVAVRERFGGPAPEALADALDAYREAARGFEARATVRRDAMETAANERQTRFNALMGGQ